MADITIESFQQKLDVLVSANAHARNKGDEFKSWCSENFGCDARISHVKEQRQITNRVSEQFRYFAPIVVFVCVPEVKRDKLIEYIMARVYDKLENVAIVGVNSNNGTRRSYTFEKILTFKRTKFTEWAEEFFVEIEKVDSPTAAQDAPPTSVTSMYPKRNKRTNKSAKLNVILYGAPGTGKTYSTIDYALKIVDSSYSKDWDRETVMAAYKKKVEAGLITFTTFHQSYGYEDFIQGLRPITVEGNLGLAPVDGVFKSLSDRAANDFDNNYVIIIDEINRANISKVLGELITLIEEDKRWGELNEMSVTLPSGDFFAVPNNLYIIGTMNTADKSISLIDTALRRRFAFMEVTPELNLIEDDALRGVLERLNKSLEQELESTDLLVGHAYFMGATLDSFADIMNQSIIPLLYEYFYDNRKAVEKQVKCAIGDLPYEIQKGTMGRIKIVKKAD